MLLNITDGAESIMIQVDAIEQVRYDFDLELMYIRYQSGRVLTIYDEMAVIAYDALSASAKHVLLEDDVEFLIEDEFIDSAA